MVDLYNKYQSMVLIFGWAIWIYKRMMELIQQDLQYSNLCFN